MLCNIPNKQEEISETLYQKYTPGEQYVVSYVPTFSCYYRYDIQGQMQLASPEDYRHSQKMHQPQPEIKYHFIWPN